MSGPTYRLTAVAFIFIILGFFSSQPVLAKVVINEIYPNPPGSADAGEWVELYNPGDTEVNLTGGILQDLKGTTHLYTFLDTIVPAQGMLVITLDQISPKITLNNDGDGLRITDTNGNTDEGSYSLNFPEDKSWGRIPDGTGDFQLTETYTKGKLNAPATPTSEINPSDTPTLPPVSPTITTTPEPIKVTLEEVMACPNPNEPEWVLLKNNWADPVTLTGWKVMDDSNHTRPVEITLKGSETGRVEWTSSMLNNDGDAVNLVNDRGTVVDSMTYEACNQGYSLTNINDAWTTAVTATPVIPSATPQPTPTSPTTTPTPPPKVSPTLVIRISPTFNGTVAGIINVATLAGTWGTIAHDMIKTNSYPWGWWLVILGGSCGGVALWPGLKKRFG